MDAVAAGCAPGRRSWTRASATSCGRCRSTAGASWPSPRSTSCRGGRTRSACGTRCGRPRCACSACAGGTCTPWLNAVGPAGPRRPAAAGGRAAARRARRVPGGGPAGAPRWYADLFGWRSDFYRGAAADAAADLAGPARRFPVAARCRASGAARTSRGCGCRRTTTRRACGPGSRSWRPRRFPDAAIDELVLGSKRVISGEAPIVGHRAHPRRPLGVPRRRAGRRETRSAWCTCGTW